jgi:hypothetical protein
MKSLFTVILVLVIGTSWAAQAPAAAPLKGQVLETMDAEPYTYLRLKTADGDVWAAVTRTPVKKGAQVTVHNPLLMTQFESKTLKRTFDRIYFGSLVGSGGGGGSSSAKTPKMSVGKVAKASGAEGRTVAEVTAQRAQLMNKTVAVRGKVVKAMNGIMGKNWVHLRDGSGSEADGTNDLLVTTQQNATLGDVVVARGVVRTDVDLGSGYSYKVLIEDATLGK